MKELEIFDPIKQEIEAFIQPAMSVAVKTKEDCSSALTIARTIKSFGKEIEERRKKIVDPLNKEVKRVNSLAKDILMPLEAAERHIKRELALFDMKLEKERLEAKAAAEQAFKREQEMIKAAEKQNELDAMFSDNTELTTNIIEEAKVLSKENLTQGIQEANKNKVTGTQKVWNFEIVSELMVPRAYLKIDEQAIRLAIRNGERDITGIRIFQETRVSIR